MEPPTSSHRCPDGAEPLGNGMFLRRYLPNTHPTRTAGNLLRPRVGWLAAATALLGSLVVAPDAGAGHDGTVYGSRYRDAVVSDTGGVVASISDYASAVGIDILDRGGNAVDAAVAMVFAVGVARPDSGGIGGGGFLVYRGDNDRLAALDFRETAPASKLFDSRVLMGEGMHNDTDDAGDGLVGSGHRVVGVPGVVAGMDKALQRLGSGKFSLGQLITNACDVLTACKRPPYAHELARDGVRVTFGLAAQLFNHQTRLRYYRETEEIYGPQRAAYGATLRQEGYAESLEFIAHNGADAFYKDAEFPDPSSEKPRDSIARLIADDMSKAETAEKSAAIQERWPNGTDRDKGYLTVADFERYRPIWRTPLTSTYRDHRIIAMPPPTSGGIATVQILNLLEGFALGSNTALGSSTESSWGQSSANHLHVLAESQKLAFADRNAYVADPDFLYDYDGDGVSEAVPTESLTSKDYAEQRRGEIKPDRAKFDCSIEIDPDIPCYNPGLYQVSSTGAEGSADTNHLSVIDREGNAVAVTTSVEAPLGSMVVAPGTGFVLNSQLHDFNMNAPQSANAPGPRKRPRSSQSPTIVVRDDKPVLVAGGAGGATIPLGVVQAIVNVVDFELDLAHALDAERIEAAAYGKQLGIESARKESDRKAGLPAPPGQRVADNVLDALTLRGHRIWAYPDLITQEPTGYFGLPIMGAVGFNGLIRQAVSDPRNEYDYFDPTGQTYGQGAMAQQG